MAIHRQDEPTLIERMHQQWEIAWEAYNINDEAATAAGRRLESAFREQQAMEDADAEARCLSFAILYQMPVTHRDAVILHFHVQMLVEQCDPTVYRKEDHAALRVATSNIFDFAVGEIHDQPLVIGPAFNRAAEFCMADRQARTARRGAA